MSNTTVVIVLTVAATLAAVAILNRTSAGMKMLAPVLGTQIPVAAGQKS